MRLALFLALIVSVLTVLGLSRSRFERREFHRVAHRLSEDQPRDQRFEQKAALEAATFENSPSWTVEGLGHTKADARQDALEKAQAKLIVFLHEQNPPVEWTPPLSYIRAHLVKSETEEEARELDPPVGQVQVVRLMVELTPDDRPYVLEQDRHCRMKPRLVLAGLILGSLVALLAAVAAYVRLDEWSKGYYTNWLRLAAVGFVGGAVALLLVFS